MPIRKAETQAFHRPASDHVADDEDGDESRQHERQDGGRRSRRKSCQAADTVTARTAIAEMDTDADKQSAEY